MRQRQHPWFLPYQGSTILPGIACGTTCYCCLTLYVAQRQPWLSLAWVVCPRRQQEGRKG